MRRCAPRSATGSTTGDARWSSPATPCPARLDRLSAGADVLVHTVVRRDLIEALGVPRLLDVLDYHSSVPDAAGTAQRAGVGTLVLTHMVPAVQPGAEQEWIDQAAAVFGGTVVVAEDLDSIETTRRPVSRLRHGGAHMSDDPREAGAG